MTNDKHPPPWEMSQITADVCVTICDSRGRLVLILGTASSEYDLGSRIVAAVNGAEEAAPAELCDVVRPRSELLVMTRRKELSSAMFRKLHDEHIPRLKRQVEVLKGLIADQTDGSAKMRAILELSMHRPLYETDHVLALKVIQETHKLATAAFAPPEAAATSMREEGGSFHVVARESDDGSITVKPQSALTPEERERQDLADALSEATATGKTEGE